MRVPEYPNPIRIRWYRVADTVPFRDGAEVYGSSNWDDDRSFDPPLGEVSTTRRPFQDWRDCSAPPWTACINCPNGAPLAYGVDFSAVANSVCNCGPLRQVVKLNYVASCLWRSAPIVFCNLASVTVTLTIASGGAVGLGIDRHGVPLATWGVDSGFRCRKLPLTLSLITSPSTNCHWPATVQLVTAPA